jgi:hypothetical protein
VAKEFIDGRISTVTQDVKYLAEYPAFAKKSGWLAACDFNGNPKTFAKPIR